MHSAPTGSGKTVLLELGKVSHERRAESIFLGSKKKDMLWIAL